MAYIGYLKYAGTEVYNIARVRAYQQNLNINWLRPGYEDSQYIAAMLGEEYRFPWLDAPWLDNDVLDSVDFWGVYPISVNGMEDSTRDAQVTESVLDGGVVGRLRNATRTMVFECALLAGSEGGAAYGLNWLKKVLNGSNCSTNSTTNCAGENLEFFSAAPFYDPDGPNPVEENNAIIRANIDGGYYLNDLDFSVDSPVYDNGFPDSTLWVWQFDGGDPYTTGGVLSAPYPQPFYFQYQPSDMDSFTRANSAVSLGSTEDKAAAWTAGAGTWGVDTGKAYVAVAAGAASYSHAYLSGDWGANWDVVLEATLSTLQGDGLAGLVFRRADANNHFDALSTELKVTVAGVETSLGTYTEPFVTGDRMRVVAQDSTITVWRQVAAAGDYVKVLEVTDASLPNNIQHGLMAYGSSATATRWDDFLIADPNFVLPEVPFSPSECLVEFQRHYRNVAFTSGPQVTRKKALVNGDHVWIVTFTAVAGVPWEFGEPVSIINDFLGPDPYWGDYVGSVSDGGSPFTDEVCLTPTWEPIVDPNCPALVPPPGAPDVDVTCFDPPADWSRHWFTLPENVITTWGDMVPVIHMSALESDVRDIRVRFFYDTAGTGEVGDECSPAGEFYFSYIPWGYTFVIDAEAQLVYGVDSLGNQRRADSLVFAADGTPFDWPAFSCGSAMVVTVDVPTYTVNNPTMSMYLVSRGA